ncbi:MAG: hypothetical protein Unbinned664contig1000_54 [Prokaryotic dsDNA virus sp.]|nr:MAG: hypothetical protein Unbinned664contig1000_54 [Prokaryotic dsDNA virus sp.]|tara:strand:+ start:9568 stop:10041 length:474 start_codon:yes stop_codon:yes gene_type:complete
MINPKQLRINVIRPVLQSIGLWSQAAENLLLGTAAQESGMGQYLVQLGNGPARGIFQMEPATLEDIEINYLGYRNDLRNKVNGFAFPALTHEDNLTCNLAFAAVMCRVHYLRKPGALPDANDIPGMAGYWKLHYNTPLGKGSVHEFVENYNRYVGSD